VSHQRLAASLDSPPHQVGEWFLNTIQFFGNIVKYCHTHFISKLREVNIGFASQLYQGEF